MKIYHKPSSGRFSRDYEAPPFSFREKEIVKIIGELGINKTKYWIVQLESNALILVPVKIGNEVLLWRHL